MILFDKFKFKMWRMMYRFFPTVQKFLLHTGIIRHDGSKRNFHIGWLAPGKSLDGLKQHLREKWGFGNHFIAWTYDEQVLNWRKLVSFQNQYHISVFADGEICGHYEFTPEAHPIEHLEEKGEREAKAEFIQFLGDFVTIDRYISFLPIDLNPFNSEPEITFDYKKQTEENQKKFNEPR